MNIQDVQRALDFPSAVCVFKIAVDRFSSALANETISSGDLMQSAREVCEASQVAHIQGSSWRGRTNEEFERFVQLAQGFLERTELAGSRLHSQRERLDLKSFCDNIQKRIAAVKQFSRESDIEKSRLNNLNSSADLAKLFASVKGGSPDQPR
jgi:hypothetical protein